jgi:hypothetical protein
MRIKEIAAACLLSCFIAGAGVAMTAPGAANGAISVERSSKGDRLPQAPLAEQSSNTSEAVKNEGKTETNNETKTETQRKGTPLGCDPAFSPVAEPTRAHYFNRCMV